MDTEKRKKLEAAGFRSGTVEDFLGLTPAELELVADSLSSSRSRAKKERRLLAIDADQNPREDSYPMNKF